MVIQGVRPFMGHLNQARVSASFSHPIPPKKRSRIEQACPTPLFAKTALRFGSASTTPIETDVVRIAQPNKPPLSIRQWWKTGEKAAMQATKGPVVLIVPGLGGKSEWGTPMVSRLIENHPLIYGMDTLALGDNPTEKGHLSNRKLMTDELQAAVDYLSEKHDGLVYLAGISLGALVVTNFAAEQPKNLGGVVLVAPAFRPARSSFKPWFYAKVMARYLMESTGIISPTPVKMPYTDDSISEEGQHLPPEAKAQISSLTASSYYQLMKMTYFEAFDKARKVVAPIFMVIPGKDTVCSPDAMRKGFNLMPATDKTMFVFPEAHHNIIFEKFLTPMTEKISQWLRGRTVKPASNEN